MVQLSRKIIYSNSIENDQFCNFLEIIIALCNHMIYGLNRDYFMNVLKNVSFLIVMIMLSACDGRGFRCKTREACVNNSKCQCWCSQKCGFRKKEASDNPLYVENDPNGKFCYCKQWDLDLYEDNCVQGKNIPQPKSAE